MNTFWRTLSQTIAKNPISSFAILCVAATAMFLGYMTVRMSGVLESSEWCAKAIQAEKISPGNTYVGLTTCVELLKIQLEALATGFHISISSYALTLIVLIVVVIAGARASFELGKDGIKGNVSKHDDPAVAAAEHVVAGAQEAAAEVKTEEAPPPPPPPPGPGWPQ